MTLATGGTITETEGYRRHTFTSSADLVVSVAGNVDYLLIGGGGGAGRTNSSTQCTGGGGGGAVKTGSPTLTAATYPVVIGGGGAGFQTDGASGGGATGNVSTFNGVTAGGGGHSINGTSAGANAVNGGSGGGGAGGGSGTPAGGTSTGGGFAGGAGFGSGTATARAGGGGGGAGAVGVAAVSGTGGNGGVGVSSSLSGAALNYGGGGGGGRANGGVGPLGAAGDSSAAPGLSGTGYSNAPVNRGGGGGGNVGVAGGGGGNGGSGLAIVRYIAPLTVTDAGDELYVNGDSVTVTGTNFIATQGTGRVVISPTTDINDAGAVAQTVTLWGNTSINITVVRGSLPYVSTCFLFVENDLDASNTGGHAVAFQAPTPTITNADDEAFNSGGEPYTITGTNFLATQGAGSVLISPTDNVNDAGAVTQGVTSWSDTSIAATSNQASLMSGVTLYLFVKNAGLVSNTAGYPVQFNFAPVTITDAGDELYDNADAVTITGAGFISLQGAGFVVISPTDDITDVGAVTQTVTGWGSTSIAITAVQGDLPLSTPLYLFVENNVGTSNLAGFPVQFEAAPLPSGGGAGFIEPIEFIDWIE